MNVTSFNQFKKNRNNPFLISLLAIFICALITITTNYTLLFSFSTAVPCDSVSGFAPGDCDPWLFIWNFFHVQQWLHGRESSLFLTHLLYYPQSLPLVYHTFSLANSIPAALLMKYLAPATCYNIVFIIQGFLSIWGTYLFARFLGANFFSALFAGWIFFAAPVRVSHLTHHLNIFSTGWIPFALLWNCKWLKENTTHALLLTSLFMLLSGYCSLYYLVALFPLLIAIDLYWILRFHHQTNLRNNLLGLLFFILLVSAGFAPRIIPMIISPQVGVRTISEVTEYSPGIEKLCAFPETNPLFREEVRSSTKIETQISPGIFLIPFIICAIVFGGSVEKRFIIVGICFYVLSLGPFLYYGREPIQFGNHSFVLPFAAIRWFPGGESIRCPGRFAILGMLFFALVVARVLPVMRQWNKHLCSSLILACIVEYVFFPLPIRSLPFFNTTRDLHTPDRSILNIPTDWDIKTFQLQQIQHQEPILFGFAARIPAELFIRYENFPIFKQLQREQMTQSSLIQQLQGIEFQDACSIFNVGWVLIHPKMLSFPINSAYLTQNVPEYLTQVASRESDSSPVIFKVDTDIAIAKRQNSRYYFYFNWYGEEKWGEEQQSVRWSMKNCGTILLATPDMAPTIMNCDLYSPHFPDFNTNRIQILSNKHLVSEITIHSGWEKVMVKINPELLEQHKFNTIEFVSERSFCPCESDKESVDCRQLGIAISNVTFD